MTSVHRVRRVFWRSNVIYASLLEFQQGGLQVLKVFQVSSQATNLLVDRPANLWTLLSGLSLWQAQASS